MTATKDGELLSRGHGVCFELGEHELGYVSNGGI